MPLFIHWLFQICNQKIFTSWEIKKVGSLISITSLIYYCMTNVPSVLLLRAGKGSFSIFWVMNNSKMLSCCRGVFTVPDTAEYRRVCLNVWPLNPSHCRWLWKTVLMSSTSARWSLLTSFSWRTAKWVRAFHTNIWSTLQTAGWVLTNEDSDGVKHMVDIWRSLIKPLTWLYFTCFLAERQVFLATWKDIPNENELQYQIKDCHLNAGEMILSWLTCMLHDSTVAFLLWGVLPWIMSQWLL